MKQERKSNFELMRIISMFMIIFWHIIIHGNLIYTSEGITNLVYTILLAIFIVHVNSFILASGYFQYNKKFSLKKFLKLFGLQWFYKVAIVIFLSTLGIVKFSNYSLFKELLPIGTENYWFINCYLTLYLISPFLNKLINSLSKKEYQKLLFIYFILFSILPFITNNITISNNGYTIVQFSFLYLIGAYINKYPTKHINHLSRRKKQLIFLTFFLSCALLNFITIILAKSISIYNNPILKEISSTILSQQFNYSPPLVIIQTIFYFLFFETLNIRSKMINKIAAVILGVYLIHDNTNIRYTIYKYLNIDNGQPPGLESVLYALIYSLLILIVCLLIEIIRSKITILINNKNFNKRKNKEMIEQEIIK